MQKVDTGFHIPRMNDADTLSDETMCVLDSIMAKIMDKKIERIKAGKNVDDLEFAFRIVCGHYCDYVEQKAAKEPEWRKAVEKKYEQSLEQIRKIGL